MAMAIPLLIANTGIGAAVAGAIGVSATTLAAVTSVAFQVTGINDKINKAASKVFGEDLVKLGNIAAIGYGVFNGGLSIGGGEAAEAASAATGGADLFAPSPLTESAWNAAGASNAEAVASAASGIGEASIPRFGGDGFRLADFGSADPVPPVDSGAVQRVTENSGVNLLDPKKPVVADSKPVQFSGGGQQATQVTPPSSGAAQQQTGASAQQATAQTATGTQAAASQAATTQAAGRAATASPAGVAPAANASGDGKSIFDRLFTGKDGNVSPQLIGGVLQGVGQGYASAQQSKAAQRQYDEELRRRTTAPNFKLT